MRQATRATVVSLALALAAGPATACGNPLLWAMLFARVPEAKSVYDADIAARGTGNLKARVFDAPAGTDFHTWSVRWLEQVSVDLDSQIGPDLVEGDSLTLLLADEVAALQFTSGSSARIIPAAELGQMTSFDAITTVNALESGLRHGLDRAHMIELGVLLPVSATVHRKIAGLF